MKKLLFSLLFLCGISRAEVWHFTHFKDKSSTMREDFFRTLRQLFKAPVFVETGTGCGDSTDRAAQVFDEVYTVEIQPDSFLTAKNRLQKYANVSLYHQDSPKGLRTILESLSADKKVLFFLDAHYNGVAGGRGDKNCPIIEELEVIFSSQLIDPVIVIDDARVFRSKEEQDYDYSLDHCDQVFEYPHVKEVIEHIKHHRPDYKVYVYGDLIIGYAEDIEVSPLIKFMTDDMINNSSIQYDLRTAQSKFPYDIFSQEAEAVAFIVNSKILHAPISYSIFFKMWQHLLSRDAR